VKAALYVQGGKRPWVFAQDGFQLGGPHTHYGELGQDQESPQYYQEGYYHKPGGDHYGTPLGAMAVLGSGLQVTIGLTMHRSPVQCPSNEPSPASKTSDDCPKAEPQNINHTTVPN